MDDRASPPRLPWIPVCFFASGFAALLYQVAWQRALFTIYGTNSSSVTVVVTAFMLGRGLGSLAGGSLSARYGVPLLVAFGVIELATGAFGFASLALFRGVGERTAAFPLPAVGATTLALVSLPTMLMGASLPLLVAFDVRRNANVGASMGTLYGVNTLGAAAAALLADVFLMRTLGQQRCVDVAAFLNLVVGATAIALARRLGVAQ